MKIVRVLFSFLFAAAALAAQQPSAPVSSSSSSSSASVSSSSVSSAPIARAAIPSALLPDDPSVLCSRSPEVCEPTTWTYKNSREHPPNPGFFVDGLSYPEDWEPFRTNREVFTNKVFLVSHGLYLASIVFDVEVTHQGLAHHKCVESGVTTDYGSLYPPGSGSEHGEAYPSRRDLYLGNLAEFGMGTAFNYMIMKLLWGPMIFMWDVGAGQGHVRGGMHWLEKCW